MCECVAVRFRVFINLSFSSAVIFRIVSNSFRNRVMNVSSYPTFAICFAKWEPWTCFCPLFVLPKGAFANNDRSECAENEITLNWTGKGLVAFSAVSNYRLFMLTTINYRRKTMTTNAKQQKDTWTTQVSSLSAGLAPARAPRRRIDVRFRSVRCTRCNWARSWCLQILRT